MNSLYDEHDEVVIGDNEEVRDDVKPAAQKARPNNAGTITGLWGIDARPPGQQQITGLCGVTCTEECNDGNCQKDHPCSAKNCGHYKRHGNGTMLPLSAFGVTKNRTKRFKTCLKMRSSNQDTNGVKMVKLATARQAVLDNAATPEQTKRIEKFELTRKNWNVGHNEAKSEALRKNKESTHEEWQMTGEELPPIMREWEVRDFCERTLETGVMLKMLNNPDACFNILVSRGHGNPDEMNRLLPPLSEYWRWTTAHGHGNEPVFTLSGNFLRDSDLIERGWEVHTIHEGRNHLNAEAIEKCLHTIILDEKRIPWGRRLNKKRGGEVHSQLDTLTCVFGVYVAYNMKGYGDLTLADASWGGRKPSQ